MTRIRMRSTLAVFVVMASALAATRLSAQSGTPPRAPMLRRELEQRFATQIREQLRLTGDQEAKLRGVMTSYAERRRSLESEERGMRQALNGQLRPGIAANPDSVSRLVDGISAARVSYARLIQDEMRELSTFLDPVQRGQLFLMRDRLFQRVQEMRENARMREPGPPPQ